MQRSVTERCGKRRHVPASARVPTEQNDFKLTLLRRTVLRALQTVSV